MSRELILDPTRVDFANINKAIPSPDVASFSQPNSAPDFNALRPGQVHIFALPRYQIRSFASVARRIFDVYSDDFFIPGLEFRGWIVEHYDSAPGPAQQALAPLTGGNWHHFFGSALLDSSGRWSVPCVLRSGSDWRRGARWLDDNWDLYDRVVLLDPAIS